MVKIGPAGSSSLSLSAVLAGGQSFRWRECEGSPGVWRGAAGAHAAEVWIERETLLLTPLSPEADADGCAAFWRRYFAMDVDYSALHARFAGNRRLAACVAAEPGIRVLHQPFFEALCAFIISQNNNIPRITGIVERLCALCGEALGDGLYAFPTPDALAGQTVESLAPLRAGWRAAYLLDAADKVASGEITEALLLALPPDEARALLQTIHGVGPKVADCAMLYGLGIWTACPMDVWMKRAMQALFPRGMPRCAKGAEGIAQQYIFEYARKNLPLGGKTC